MAKIEIDNIQEIKICNFWDDSLNTYSFRVERLGNRLAKQCIAIEVKQGFIKLYVLTPKYPNAFLTQVQESILKE